MMGYRFNLALVFALLLGGWMVGSVGAENWPRWRGPDGNCVSSESPLPVEWSATKNVRWKAAIPGEGSSSPIVWEERVYVTSALADGKRRVVHCLDRSTGKLLWSREIKHDSPEQTSSVTGHAAATPATNGRHIVAFFGNAGVFCLDFSGQELWRKDLGEFDNDLGLASSPVIYRDWVILVCDHDGDRSRTFDSFLIALELKTGKQVWKTERRDLYRSWSTPVVVPVGDRHELIVNAQDQLRGYDIQTGKEKWRWEGMTNWVTPSPVFGHGSIFATSGKNGPIVAVRPGGGGKVEAVWKQPGGPYVCSPLLYGDHLYVGIEGGRMQCFDARTGKLIWREQLDGKFTASPAAGDGKVYWTNEHGVTYVIRAGAKFEVLARNRLGEFSVASPAIAARRLFLRTERHLYCIGD